MASKPTFVSVDVAQIVTDMIAFFQTQFQSITGVPCTLQPAQIERLIINMCAYREGLVRSAINETACQNLPQFSTAPVLDYICALFGVTRIPSQPTTCQIEFVLVTGHGSGVIPAGVRISTTDGAIIFTTDTQTSFTSTDSSVIVNCTATVPGVAGNGYIAGAVNTIVDPQSAVSSAANLGTTAGGTDDETDDALRERLLLASDAFSTAGSDDAYKFHARSADASIVDVEVISPIPGHVSIYPLVAGGITTPNNVLQKVLAACSADKVRPLTDNVSAFSPTRLDYRITVDLTLYDTADQAVAVQKVNDALAAYSTLAKGTLGHNIESNKINALSAAPDEVYTAAVTLEQQFIIFGSPVWFSVTSIIVGDTQFAFNNQTTVSIAGTTNG